MSRCTGHCCKDFPLPVSKEQLLAEPARWRDGAQIGEMIIFLRESTYTSGTKQYRYTCKHLTAQGDCAIYNNRPWMCSAYPYGEACTNKDCTADNNELIKLTKVYKNE